MGAGASRPRPPPAGVAVDLTGGDGNARRQPGFGGGRVRDLAHDLLAREKVGQDGGVDADCGQNFFVEAALAQVVGDAIEGRAGVCLLYTSDAADERSSVDLGGRRIIKKKKRV